MQTNTGRFGIRGKLISIFIVIKVVPLVLLALLAWTMAEKLGDAVGLQLESVSSSMLRTLRSVGEEATQDALHALDDRARESMERLTTDTARAVAAFLYDRDADIREAAELEPGDASYRRFLAHRQRPVFSHGPWKLADDGKRWEPAAPESWDESLAADAGQALSDNAKAFSARPPEFLGHREMRPLFVEMSFIDLSGRERVKVTQGSLMTPGLRQVSDARETFIRAEHYWPELQKLKPGEIHVSDVVGAYVKSHVIGPYLPASAEKAGEPFKPEASAYAGTENPVGRHFRGIVRWAMPVVRQGQITGYVTLALDHDHIRQFTDRISPTDARYTPINDAIAGNYAFMWDHRGRAISHPRDYFIPGYDPATGEPVTPWMDQSLYEAWQSSGKSSQAFLEGVKPYDDQSLKKKPAGALVKAGTVALDCRYLNFSPQCSGWKLLTEKGGSGSFVIFFSGLWKLTTAAAIPYYTGPYAASPQGFGIVTIGANVDDFHRAATESAKRIGLTIDAKDKEFQTLRAGISQAINDNLTQTAGALAISTLVMVAVVIAVAIWMAQFITRRITRMIEGLDGFQAGDLSRRLEVKSTDEMGHLAESFDSMADPRPVAIDALGPDQILDIVQRLHPLAADAEGELLIVPAGERGEAGLDAGRDLAAVAAGAAPAGGFRVDHQGGAAAPGRLARRHQAGIAGANDQHVDLARQGGVALRRARRVVPPIGLRLEARRQQFPAHACVSSRSMARQPMSRRQNPSGQSMVSTSW